MQISVILPSRTCQMCLCLALRGLGFGRDLNTSEVSCWQHQLHKLNPKPLRPTSWSTAMSNSSHQPWSSWKILRDPQEVSLKFLFVTHASLCLCVCVCVCGFWPCRVSSDSIHTNTNYSKCLSAPLKWQRTCKENQFKDTSHKMC